MELEKVNRLPMLTYRNLHTNDSALPFRKPETCAAAVFSDMTFVSAGGDVPEAFEGASEKWKDAALSGERYTISVPEGEEAALTVTVTGTDAAPDYAGAFVIRLAKGAKLSLIWKYEGTDAAGVYGAAAAYELAEGAVLHASLVQSGMREKVLAFQRCTHLAEKAEAYFASAELGGDIVIVHSRGKLAGRKAVMHESDLYTAEGTQHLDFFYNIDHYGEDSESDIDVKGALAGKSKKVFRGNIDFKRGCAGAVGSEGDYAIQLDPETKNISLPLLLCTEDNVMGNHASSAGQVDPDTVYYLMTRGLSEEAARRIVVESLISPLVDKLDESLREDVLAAVREKLDRKEDA